MTPPCEFRILSTKSKALAEPDQDGEDAAAVSEDEIACMERPFFRLRSRRISEAADRGCGGSSGDSGLDGLKLLLRHGGFPLVDSFVVPTYISRKWWNGDIPS